MADRSCPVTGPGAATLSAISELGIVPVVTFTDPELAEPVLEALCAGGLPVVEVTLRVPGAIDVVGRLVDAFPDAIVGAGSVLSVEDATAVMDNGARFVVSPLTDPAVMATCLRRDVPVVPGACTPTEVRRAQEAGAELVKFFPAEPMGGRAFLQAVAGPMPAARFVPTGGLNAANLAGYAALPNVAACGGSWMVPRTALAEHRFGDVSRLAGEALAIVAQARGRG